MERCSSPYGYINTEYPAGHRDKDDALKKAIDELDARFAGL